MPKKRETVGYGAAEDAREGSRRPAASNAARHAEFDLRPCAGYGHVGRAGVPWEALTHVDALKEAAQQAA